MSEETNPDTKILSRTVLQLSELLFPAGQQMTRRPKKVTKVDVVLWTKLLLDIVYTTLGNNTNKYDIN